MTLSNHAALRSHQRAVSPAMLELVLAYGRESESFEDRAYVLDDRSLRKAPPTVRRLADRFRGLCIVVCPDQTVRTVMWKRAVRRRPGVLRRSRLVEAELSQSSC